MSNLNNNNILITCIGRKEGVTDKIEYTSIGTAKNIESLNKSWVMIVLLLLLILTSEVLALFIVKKFLPSKL